MSITNTEQVIMGVVLLLWRSSSAPERAMEQLLHVRNEPGVADRVSLRSACVAVAIGPLDGGPHGEGGGAPALRKEPSQSTRRSTWAGSPTQVARNCSCRVSGARRGCHAHSTPSALSLHCHADITQNAPLRPPK